MDLEESRICGRLSCVQVLEFLNVTGKMTHGKGWKSCYVRFAKRETIKERERERERVDRFGRSIVRSEERARDYLIGQSSTWST